MKPVVAALAWRASLALLVLALLSGCCTPKKVDAALEDDTFRALARCTSGLELPPGEACRFRVNSGAVSTPLPINAQAGDAYSIHVPSGQSWTDWSFDADPLLGFEGGALMNLLVSKRRLPNESWFALGVAHRICEGATECVEQQSRRVFTDAILVAPTRGDLVFFANDVPCFYWNNCGYIWIKVMRSVAQTSAAVQ